MQQLQALHSYLTTAVEALGLSIKIHTKLTSEMGLRLYVKSMKTLGYQLKMEVELRGEIPEQLRLFIVRNHEIVVQDVDVVWFCWKVVLV